MFRPLSGRLFKGAAAAALTAVVSLAAVAPSFAATHHAARTAAVRTYYNYAPGQVGASGLTAGQLGRRTDPVLVAPGGYGPPDPASCGGFHC